MSDKDKSSSDSTRDGLPAVYAPIWWLILALGIIVGTQLTLNKHIAELPKFKDGRNTSFVITTDMDKYPGSKNADGTLWQATALVGSLTVDSEGLVNVSWLEDKHFQTNVNAKSRSMELSALEYIQNQLWAFCDRTGFVFSLDMSEQEVEIVTQLTSPVGGFKSEWVVQKDGLVYVGSNGKEWVEDGKVIHEHLKTVKVFEKGVWRDEDWTERYTALREHLNCGFPGYVIHEAVAWDHRQKEWLFLPRKVSPGLGYDEDADETRGGNVLLRVSEDFSRITSVAIGPLEADWGYTALKLLPPGLQPSWSEATHLAALKVKEVNGVLASKLAVFNTDGLNKFQDEKDIFHEIEGELKFEALAFVNDEVIWPVDPVEEEASKGGLLRETFGKLIGYVHQLKEKLQGSQTEEL